MASGSSSYAMNVVAGAAPPVASQARRSVTRAPLEVFEMFRGFLENKDIAKSRAVSRDFNAEGGFSLLQIQTMRLYWLRHVAFQEVPFLPGGSFVMLGAFAHDTMGINIRPNDIILKKVALTEISDSEYRSVRRLAAPINRREIAQAIVTSPEAMVILACCTGLMQYSYRAYPQLSSTVMTVAVAWAFRRAGGRDLINSMDRNGREFVAAPLGHIVVYNRFHTMRESIVRAFSEFSRPSNKTVVLGAATLLLHVEEAFIRPALPTLVANVYSVIISAVPMAALGTVVGFGVAYVAKKCHSYFFHMGTHERA